MSIRVFAVEGLHLLRVRLIFLAKGVPVTFLKNVTDFTVPLYAWFNLSRSLTVATRELKKTFSEGQKLPLCDICRKAFSVHVQVNLYYGVLFHKKKHESRGNLEHDPERTVSKNKC